MNRVICLLVTATVLSGCSTPPKLDVESAYIATPATSTTPAVAHVVMLASNPTDQPMPLWEIEYKASSNQAGSSQPSSGKASLFERWTSITIDAFATHRFELPVVLDNGAQVIDLSGTVSYVPQGRFRELLTEIGIPLPTENFSGSAPLTARASDNTISILPMRVITGQRVRSEPKPPADTLPPLSSSPLP